MGNDIVFKFVTLRAPVRPGESAQRGAIEPPAEVVAALEVSLAQISHDQSFKSRLALMSETFMSGPDYLLNHIGWRRLYAGARPVNDLLGDREVSAKDFRMRADAMLDALLTPNDQRGEGWQASALNLKIWLSYYASLFAPGEHGQATYFLLNVIRLAYGYRESQERAGTMDALALSERRVALPGVLTIGLEPRRVEPEAGRPAPARPNQLGRLAAEILALRNLSAALDRARRQRRWQLSEATKQALRTDHEVQPDRNAQPSPETIDVSAVRASPSGLDRSLDDLARHELDDPRAGETLDEYGLDLMAGIAGTKRNVDALIADRSSQLRRLQQQTFIAWGNGSLVHLIGSLRPEIEE